MGRNLKLSIILFLIFTASFMVAFYLYNPHSTKDLSPNLSSILNPNNHPGGERSFDIVTLGTADYGTVTRMGPYGNPDSADKIAIIVGVHPQEAQAHQAFIDSLKEHNSTLQGCYYIYRVKVTRDVEDYQKGRDHGQVLARQYVVPDILKQDFDLVVDVHSNQGNYQLRRFIYLPAPSPTADRVASQVVKKIKWLSIYSPPNPTSPEYVTIPLIKSGVPAFIYETYLYEPYHQSKTQADQFISVLDTIQI